MKIYLTKLLNNDTWDYNLETIYKIINLDECCNNILKCPLIDFVVENGDPTISLVHTEDVSLPYEYVTFHNSTYYPIKFCPFCNAEIKIEILEEIDVASISTTLEGELEELCKQARKRSSRKKEKELRDQISYLRKQLEYYMAHDNFNVYRHREAERV